MSPEERVAENEMRFRQANERILAKAVDLGVEQQALPFLCECSDARCTTVLRLTLGEYRDVRSSASRFLILPGHDTEELEAGSAVTVQDGDRYHVIEKCGTGGDPAATTA